MPKDRKSLSAFFNRTSSLSSPLADSSKVDSIKLKIPKRQSTVFGKTAKPPDQGLIFAQKRGRTGSVPKVLQRPGPVSPTTPPNGLKQRLSVTGTLTSLEEGEGSGFDSAPRVGDAAFARNTVR